MAINLIEEAVSAGARCSEACAVVEIDMRTLQRWKRRLVEDRTLEDQRAAAAADRVPANKLSEAEREAILAVCNQPRRAFLNCAARS
jgi:transposase